MTDFKWSENPEIRIAQEKAYELGEEQGVTKTKISCKGCGHHDTAYGTLFSSDEWLAWEKEVSKRMHEQEGKEMMEGVWDVDEARELGCMSKGHWDDFIAWVRLLEKKQLIEDVRREVEHKKEGYKLMAYTSAGHTTEQLVKSKSHMAVVAALSDLLNSPILKQ